MREIALHLLDIAENSIAAGAKTIEITVEEDVQNDRLTVIVQDDGQGMDEQFVAQLGNPFVTSRTTRKVGLGISLLKAAAEACHGCLSITSISGWGTRLAVEFQRSHIDRMPLGDLAGTMLTLIVFSSRIHWLFHYRANISGHTDEATFTFDNEAIKRELDEIPLTEPVILAFIRELLQEGVDKVQRAIEKQEVI